MITFQIIPSGEGKIKFSKNESKLKMTAYEAWTSLMDKIKEFQHFYMNQSFYYCYLQDYIQKELKYYVQIEKIIKIYMKAERKRIINRSSKEQECLDSELNFLNSFEETNEIKALFLNSDEIELVDEMNLIHTIENKTTS